MTAHVIKGFALDDLTSIRDVVAEQRSLEPFPSHIHPVYGDIRPQRLPARNWREPDLDPNGFLMAFSFKCEQGVSDLLGQPLKGSERYFLYYPPPTLMHPHTDKVPTGEHWRLGVVVTQSPAGGVLQLEGQDIHLEEGDAYLFDAQQEHAVTTVTEGERIVWTMAFYFCLPSGSNH